ncbi:unnamed protein product [Phytophthora fragariaefolia]|uniref:Unnamed protein product n=1 Tax=Phytophthora fragariaefolia TaxID=1490495 RepID=A0A9W6XM30_9STRA|nr:unnamed protein product [Phytophthora fragariaefolia]
MARDVRVRLVFADDVGRHVLRRRGFSSCWYLVPPDAKLVGDVAHALLREFELRRRCPQGLELRLEELPLLATQSARVVRDDDTIVVNCPALRGVQSDGEDASSESEQEAKIEGERRKRKRRQTQEKTRRLQDAKKEVKGRRRAESKKKDGVAAAVKSRREESSVSSSESESSSSSSNSSSSSSESSGSEEEDAEQRSRKRVAQVASECAQPAEAGTAKKAKSKEVTSSTNAPAQAKKEPRRRRRRLRQRNGRRQRNGEQSNTVENTVRQALPRDDNDSTSQEKEQTAQKRNKSAETRVDTNDVTLRGYPRAKAHVLFDEVTGDQVAVQHDDHLPGDNNWAARCPQAPELAKYGPSSSSNQWPSCINQTRPSASSNEKFNEEKERSGNSDVSKRKGKGKFEEMWKRPYEIVATVLDGNTNKSSISAEVMNKSLASFPTATADFKPKDVIAYKTLTLCLETWQPLLSAWQCGEVQSVDASGNSIEVSKWTLETNGESVHFHEAPTTEQCNIQTSEISELKFLSGPTYSSLRQ